MTISTSRADHMAVVEWQWQSVSGSQGGVRLGRNEGRRCSRGVSEPREGARASQGSGSSSGGGSSSSSSKRCACARWTIQHSSLR